MDCESYKKFVPKEVLDELRVKHRREDSHILDWNAIERACTPYFLGKKFRISSFDVGALGRFTDSDKVFCVGSRYPEDRSSGGCSVVFKDGSVRDFVWDYDNPEAVFLGWGKVVTKIEFEEGYPYQG